MRDTKIVYQDKLVLLVPLWPAPSWVSAVVTTRQGGVSAPPYAEFNLSTYVGDSFDAVMHNRSTLRQTLDLSKEPCWLQQTHGVEVVQAAHPHTLQADASWTDQANTACVVQTADCLSVLFCDVQGRYVAAAHAGWRGLCAGVLEKTVASLPCDSRDVMAWLGPAIGPQAFVVQEEVRTAFMAVDPKAESAFRPAQQDGWLADLFQLARQRLQSAGVRQIYGGDACTVREKALFFSYRRDEGLTGRMASLIWIKES